LIIGCSSESVWFDMLAVWIIEMYNAAYCRSFHL
jgi:hypothetical protein